MKRFLVLVLAAIIAVPLHSRKYPDVPRAYAYGNSLDLQGGLVGMPFSVSGDAGRAFGIGAGGEFNIRYSHFFWKHWGIFASFSYLGTTVDAPCYFGTVNRADGGRYRYGKLSNSDFRTFGRDNSFSGAAFLVGAAYRYDFGGWSLRPMIGVGFGDYEVGSFSYKCTPREGGVPIGVSYKVEELRVDYLDEPVSRSDRPIAVLSASLQLTYTFNHHFYLSVECGLKSFPNEYRYVKTTYQFKKAYEPSNWAESVAMSELEDKYVLDKNSATTSLARLPFNFLNLNFGIGWNLGRNRYQSGKY